MTDPLTFGPLTVIESREPGSRAERFERKLAAFVKLESACKWAIGDLLNDGEQHLGEHAYHQAVANVERDTGVSQERLEAYRRQSAAFPKDHRNLNLSWSHYAKVMNRNLTHEERQCLLGAAQEQGMTSDELRAEVRQVLDCKGALTNRARWDAPDALEKFQKFRDECEQRWPLQHYAALRESLREWIDEFNGTENGSP